MQQNKEQAAKEGQVQLQKNSLAAHEQKLVSLLRAQSENLRKTIQTYHNFLDIFWKAMLKITEDLKIQIKPPEIRVDCKEDVEKWLLLLSNKVSEINQSKQQIREVPFFVQKVVEKEKIILVEVPPKQKIVEVAVYKQKIVEVDRPVFVQKKIVLPCPRCLMSQR